MLDIGRNVSTFGSMVGAVASRNTTIHNNDMNPTATGRQTVDRVDIMAFLTGDSYESTRVQAVIVNDILTDVELFGRKRSDFSSLRDCVYSHLVEMGRGNVDLGQFFKD